MELGAELIQMVVSADQNNAQLLDFIKTCGEKGNSVIAALAIYEEMEKSEPNRYLALKTEYAILLSLTRAMREDLRRMEEEEN